MPRGKNGDTDGTNRPARKQGKVGESYSAEFRGYINLPLSDEQKSGYDAWAAGAHLWAQLEASTADGVNVALKLDPKQEGFLASATQRREGSPNAGLVVTARGRDASTAWGRLLFILFILAPHERWEDVQPIANPDRW